MGLAEHSWFWQTGKLTSSRTINTWSIVAWVKMYNFKVITNHNKANYKSGGDATMEYLVWNVECSREPPVKSLRVTYYSNAAALTSPQSTAGTAKLEQQQ
jgi:hypothetical protein